MAYRARKLNPDARHADKGLVEVFYGALGVGVRLVAHISNAAGRDQLGVCYCFGRLRGEVGAEVGLGEGGGEAADKDTG